jgi:hypothetical protein
MGTDRKWISDECDGLTIVAAGSTSLPTQHKGEYRVPGDASMDTRMQSPSLSDVSTSQQDHLPGLRVSDAMVGRLAQELQEARQQCGVLTALAVGRMLCVRLLAPAGGEEETPLVRETLRRVAAWPGVRMSAASLSRAIAIWRMSQRIPIQELKGLHVNHLVEVLAVDPARQEALLREAAAEGWTVRELRQQVRQGEVPPDRLRSGGRPPKPAVERVVDRLRVALVEADASGLAPVSLSASERARIVEKIHEARALLYRLESVFEQQEPSWSQEGGVS